MRCCLNGCLVCCTFFFSCLTKIPVWKRNLESLNTISHISGKNIESPMFITVDDIISPVSVNLRRNKTFKFFLTHLQVDLFKQYNSSTNLGDDPLLYEIQVKFFSCSDEGDDSIWNDIFYHLEVNKVPIEVQQPSPHVVYITEFCSLVKNGRNDIILSSSRPESLDKYMFCVSFVERRFPLQLMSICPLKNNLDTNSMISKKLDEIERRKFVLPLVCPFTKSILKYPGRGIHCKHIECFDVLNFLNEMQYFLKWKCIICQKYITYSTLAVDNLLKKYTDEEKGVVVFYKPRAYSMLTDEHDSDISCEQEVIYIGE